MHHICCIAMIVFLLVCRCCSPSVADISDVVSGNDPRSPMGPWSLCGSAWGSCCTKSGGHGAHTHAHDDTAIFTQVWAAVRHKTLLLLWWIEVEDGYGCEVQIPGRVPQECHYAHTVYGVLVYGSSSFAMLCPESNPLLGCLGPPFIVQGVTTVAKQSFVM
jgi:hypothetical protein